VNALAILTCALAWWLGLYLVGRDPARPLLRRAGLGMAFYALALAADLLSANAPFIGLAIVYGRIHAALIFLPALCWAGALIQLLPEDMPLRARLDRAWKVDMAAAIVLASAGAAVGDRLFSAEGAAPFAAAAGLVLAALVLLPLVAGAILVARYAYRTRSRNAVGLAIAATLFFTLGLVLLVAPLGLLPRSWSLLAIGLDLLLFDFGVVALDAFDQGETLWPDVVRSFFGAAFAALLFGSQVALVMLLFGSSFALLALLLAIVAAAIALQVFADPIQAALDRLAFVGTPRLRRERAELRAVASALPRVDAERPLAEVDEAEFARLVRRALSHYGDLPRLAASPLTRLPAIEARLLARGAPDNPLERAAELKTLLAESIERLKPRGAAAFGATDEWRHYNALFFPYIAGVKPYSRRAANAGLAPAARAALDWFAANVPERTLYNWQNAAARLIARDLRGQIQTRNTESATFS
jgi:hypothetical protein